MADYTLCCQKGSIGKWVAVLHSQIFCGLLKGQIVWSLRTNFAKQGCALKLFVFVVKLV